MEIEQLVEQLTKLQEVVDNLPNSLRTEFNETLNSYDARIKRENKKKTQGELEEKSVKQELEELKQQLTQEQSERKQAMLKSELFKHAKDADDVSAFVGFYLYDNQDAEFNEENGTWYVKKGEDVISLSDSLEKFKQGSGARFVNPTIETTDKDEYSETNTEVNSTFTLEDFLS
jgi:predicted RecB family nuclease